MPSSSSMPSMSGMASTFSSSTRVTLWFTTWTTTTPVSYFLTTVFLFTLSILDRFLGAFESQLERKWQDQQNLSKHTFFSASVEKPPKSDARSQARTHTRQWSRASRPQPVRLEEPGGQETEPLSPVAQPQHVEEGVGANPVPISHRFWVANASWSIKKDGISAGLEFMRALVGYILYALWSRINGITTKLTPRQDACGHDLQHWIPLCSYWQRITRRDGFWKIYKRLCKLSGRWMSLIDL
jgi:hypothetical protein